MSSNSSARETVWSTTSSTDCGGQPYRIVYGAFSNLRHQLGRCADEPWYRYTFSDTDFAVNVQESPPSSFDPRHRPD